MHPTRVYDYCLHTKRTHTLMAEIDAFQLCLISAANVWTQQLITHTRTHTRTQKPYRTNVARVGFAMHSAPSERSQPNGVVFST